MKEIDVPIKDFVNRFGNDRSLSAMLSAVTSPEQVVSIAASTGLRCSSQVISEDHATKTARRPAEDSGNADFYWRTLYAPNEQLVLQFRGANAYYAIWIERC